MTLLRMFMFSKALILIETLLFLAQSTNAASQFTVNVDIDIA